MPKISLTHSLGDKKRGKKKKKKEKYGVEIGLMRSVRESDLGV